VQRQVGRRDFDVALAVGNWLRHDQAQLSNTSELVIARHDVLNQSCCERYPCATLDQSIPGQA
jgi:hypothetical protein